MVDLSEKDKKYFVDGSVYNCPYCNRRSVRYTVDRTGGFHWDNSRIVYYYVIKCLEPECLKSSLHLSNYNLAISTLDRFENPPVHVTMVTIPGPVATGGARHSKKHDPVLRPDGSRADLDDVLFFHQPSSFFTVDDRIPSEIRRPLSEADNCRRSNFLTGASGCLRKAIYKLLKSHTIPDKTASGDPVSYEDRIEMLKTKYPSIDPEYFGSLKIVQGVTSVELHENEWVDLDSPALTFLLETFHEILYEIYVDPDERKERRKRIIELSPTYS